MVSSVLLIFSIYSISKGDRKSKKVLIVCAIFLISRERFKRIFPVFSHSDDIVVSRGYYGDFGSFFKFLPAREVG